MAQKTDGREKPTPDQRKLTDIQAKWLAGESGLSQESLTGIDIGSLHEKLRFVINPELLLFRKVCGRVVKKDRESGQYWGVPNATVHVEDTDGSFLGFFPDDHPYFWLWPLGIRRETLAEVVTDACGRFCVWIPRWDIDRILRLRRRRVCLPDVFKPTLKDAIEKIKPPKAGPRDPVPPGPGPDPQPIEPIDIDTLHRLADALGSGADKRLGALAGDASFGTDLSARLELLSEPAFEDMPPPLRTDLGKRLKKLKSPMPKATRDLMPDRIDLGAYLGPFLGCVDVITPEWTTILDVPDITFRVTQDVDGDGDEETIYSEGYFDVRWNAGEIDPVTLVARPEALATSYCGPAGPAVPCRDKPEFHGIDNMPVTEEYHDPDTGHSVRINPPRVGGLSSGAPDLPAKTPYAEVLNLMACHRLEGATHQRVLYRHGEIGPAPLLVEPWYARTPAGRMVRLAQDPDGWVPILEGDDQPEKEDWVLQWDTRYFSPGAYSLYVECKDASGDPVGERSDELLVFVDNRRCSLGFGTIGWRHKSTSATPAGFSPLPVACPVIRRKPRAAIELEVPWSAAAEHFRDAKLSFFGCGASPEEIPALGGDPHTFEAWHAAEDDTGAAATAYYEVGGDRPEGAYRLRLSGFTRGFCPRLEVGGEFIGDQSLLWTGRSQGIAIVDDPRVEVP